MIIQRIIHSKLAILTIGFLLGFSCFLMAFKFSLKKDKVYFKLNHDYCIENIGHLKAGTLLQIDEGFSEGFTRYILYINIKDNEQLDLFKPEGKNTVIPYWLNEMNSACLKTK